MKIHRIFAAFYAAALCTFTVYLALDTFVLQTVYQTNASEMNLSMFEQEPSADTSINTDSSEEKQSRKTTGRRKSSQADASSEISGKNNPDPTVSTNGTERTFSNSDMTVTLKEYRFSDTTVYAADVQLSSAQYLKSAFAYDTYGKNITAATSSIAAEHDAVLAVNGDYYGVQETGYVIRNGIVYRDSSNGKDLLCVFSDGSMQILSSNDYTAEELVDAGVWQAYCFGPALIENGCISVSAGEEVGRAMASNPRTAIGMIDNLHYVLVVSDGRTTESSGLSLSELADFMLSLGVKTAYNLDGGGSSAMYFQGEIVNKPTTNGNRIQERGVSDIVYIG